MTNLLLGKLLKIPRGTPDMAPMEIELGEIEAIELRKPEMAYVNRETAPELMYVFNKGYSDTFRLMINISFEYTQAVKHANKRKAIVTLEVAPDILAKKGLRTSEDLRKAVIDSDDEYLALQDKVHIIEAAYEFLKGKAKGFEMAYQSVKKIYDAQNSSLGNMHNLHDSISERVRSGETETVSGSFVGDPKF